MTRHKSGCAIETSSGGRTDAPATASPRTAAGRFKDLAVALLPLGIWVTGAVAYERIAPPALEATRPAAMIAPLTRMSSLRDQRSLLDIMPADAPELATRAPQAMTDTLAIRLINARDLVVATDVETRFPIAIEPARSVPAGAYLVVRGVPLDAALSHGIAIGPEIWLVDGADIERVALRAKAGVQARRELTFQLVSVDGRLLAEDRLFIEAQSFQLPEPPVGVASTLASTLQATAAAPQVMLPRAADEPTQPDVAAAAAPQIKPAAQSNSVKAATLATFTDIAKPVAPATAPISVPILADTKAIETALARGRRMLEIGNIAVARPLLERAAASGSAAAAVLVGSSYDGDWLKRNGAVGVTADPIQARRWYGEARRLGSPEADKLLAALASH